MPRVHSPEDAAPLIYRPHSVQENGSLDYNVAVTDGPTLYIPYDDAPPIFSDVLSEEARYKLRQNARGSEEVIPSRRVIYAHRVDGIHVPEELVGLRVAVPTKAHWFERRAPYDQPAEIRFYEAGRGDLLSDEFCLNAIARAVYEVANGKNTEGHAEKIERAFETSVAEKALRDQEEAAELAEKKLVHAQNPHLRVLEARRFRAMMEQAKGDHTDVSALTEAIAEYDAAYSAAKSELA